MTMSFPFALTGFSPLAACTGTCPLMMCRLGFCDSECVEDVVCDALFLSEFEVPSFFLSVGLLVGDEVSLEGGHLRLVEEQAVGPAP